MHKLFLQKAYARYEILQSLKYDSLEHVTHNISTATASANKPCKW
jgi:hypothetical protein